MANMENLTNENVEELQNFFREKIEPKNEDATLKIYEMKEKIDLMGLSAKIDDLIISIDNLTQKIERVFGNHILINGSFKQLTNTKGE